MKRRRSESDEQIADLLRTAKDSLHLSVAFLSRLDGTTQHLDVVESSVPFLFQEGATQKQSTSFCQVILDGDLPAVIPDVRQFPVAMALPAARIPRIRSYVSSPIYLSDGSLYGTLCAAGLTSDKELADRDKGLMDVLARAASVVIEPGVRARERHDEIEHRLEPVQRSGGPRVLLQPIVDIVTGERVGAEALSRFPQEWDLAPDVVFAQAHSVGRGHQLELLALRRAATLLDRVSGYVSMNVSPATLLTPPVIRFLRSLPLSRTLLELSEHDQVEDYDTLRAVLAPLRAAGLRLAIDDVGAGFSSLRHIVLLEPDVLKLDRTIVHGLGGDRVLHSLVRSMVDFATGLGALVVAEGVETAADAVALHDLRVGYGQGWFWGRAVPADLLDDRFPAVPAAGLSDSDATSPLVPQQLARSDREAGRARTSPRTAGAGT